jgi:hypothetical protein
MSTLSVTTINTKDNVTDLTATTGNTSAAKFVISSSGGFAVYSNSTTVSMNVASNGTILYFGNVGYGNSAPATKLQLGGNYGISAITISSSNNININCALGNYFIATCNGSAANIYFTNTPANTGFSVLLKLANGGTNTISWANTPKWPAAVAPSASSNTDIWIFFTDDGGVTWRGNQVQKDSR